MQISRYFSKEQIQSGNAYRAAQARSAAEYMSPGQQAMPGALQQLAQGMDKLNAVVTQEELRKRNELMELDLLKEMQDLQGEAATWEDEYRQQFQGRGAVNAETDARASRNLPGAIILTRNNVWPFCAGCAFWGRTRRAWINLTGRRRRPDVLVLPGKERSFPCRPTPALCPTWKNWAIY